MQSCSEWVICQDLPYAKKNAEKIEQVFQFLEDKFIVVAIKKVACHLLCTSSVCSCNFGGGPSPVLMRSLLTKAESAFARALIFFQTFCNVLLSLFMYNAAALNCVHKSFQDLFFSAVVFESVFLHSIIFLCCSTKLRSISFS